MMQKTTAPHEKKYTLTINGQPYSAPKNWTLLKTLLYYDIFIPHLCHSPVLKTAGHCRLCMVEVNGLYMPACTTLISPDQNVETETPVLREMRRITLTLLLENHPLDCWQCEKGGHCELQTLIERCGVQESLLPPFQTREPSFKHLGAFQYDPNKCVHCSRCVRYLKGIHQPKMLPCHRGALRSFEPDETQPIQLFGNESVLLNLCPVGALSEKEKTVRRPFELQKTPSISREDVLGQAIVYHLHHQTIHTIEVPPPCDPIQPWIRPKERASPYTTLERLEYPMVRKSNQLERVTWREALETMEQKLQAFSVLDSNHLIGLIHPHATVEECSAFQAWIRDLGSDAIEHRLSYSDPVSLWSCMPEGPRVPFLWSQLSSYEHIFLVGVDVSHTFVELIPYLSNALSQTTSCSYWHEKPIDFPFPKPNTTGFSGLARIDSSSLGIPLGGEERATGVYKDIHEDCERRSQHRGKPKCEGYIEEKIDAFPSLFTTWVHTYSLLLETLRPHQTNSFLSDSMPPPEPISFAWAKRLMTSPKTVCILGDTLLKHPMALPFCRLFQEIARVCGMQIGYLCDGPNYLGAYQAKAYPQYPSERPVLETKVPCYVLYDVDPIKDCFNGPELLTHLQQADGVISFASVLNPSILEVSDIVLPIANAFEKEGTYVNCEGTPHSFSPIFPLFSEIQAGTTLLQALRKRRA